MMSQLPASSSSSSSSSSATTTDSAHCNCPSCQRRMSSSKFDKHSICFSCKPIKCDVSNRCSECADWSPSEIEDYLKHRRSLESKSKCAKTGDSALPSVSPTLVMSASDSQPRVELDLREIQSRVQADVKSLFANFIEQFRRTSQGPSSQDVHALNPSSTAPPVVPDIGTLEMGPAGDATTPMGPIAVPGSAQPSGAVQPHMQETPSPLFLLFHILVYL